MTALREVEGDPDTFPWCTALGAGPVFRRTDGSAVGPMVIEQREVGDGGFMVTLETVVVRPPASAVASPP